MDRSFPGDPLSNDEENRDDENNNHNGNRSRHGERAVVGQIKTRRGTLVTLHSDGTAGFVLYHPSTGDEDEDKDEQGPPSSDSSLFWAAFWRAEGPTARARAARRAAEFSLSEDQAHGSAANG
jgi:hypothetical protein